LFGTFDVPNTKGDPSHFAPALGAPVPNAGPACVKVAATKNDDAQIKPLMRFIWS
jgi:hypothetical protein